jgi:hypothetical protein
MILASSTKHKRKRRWSRKPESKWEQNNNKNPKRKENKQKERVTDERNSTEQHDLLRTEWSLESSLLRIKTPFKWTFWGFQSETPIRNLALEKKIWFVMTEILKSSLSPSKPPTLEMRKSLQTCRAPIWNYHQFGRAEIYVHMRHTIYVNTCIFWLCSLVQNVNVLDFPILEYCSKIHNAQKLRI